MGSNPTPSAIQKARALKRSGGLWPFEFWESVFERSLSFPLVRLCGLASPFCERSRAVAVGALAAKRLINHERSEQSARIGGEAGDQSHLVALSSADGN